ncbi:putative ATP/GTP binding protein [Alloactinosynnema sp. L-07]|uniref:tetratricopeptide repeat protein n=1 Tax=Alloactinosynnema sp. L-07 TaxID=1653480 RepID=UPI00065F0686|nr:toll/interleukin-1 receptor domain-containing protein [Alloactinosynnema sp. L-07]CRK57682.1 putative ATP/GTP binding protein [Alloactinosynnema sp. L-07]
MVEGSLGYDVFLCYKSEDAVAAEELRLALVAKGLTVFRDEISGGDWAPLGASIEQALLRSRTLVALITPHFPISPHCREELHMALTAAYHLDAGDTSRVMAVAQGVSPDDIRPRQLTRFRLPRSGLPTAELVASIAAGVHRHDRRTFGDAPRPREPKWYPRELPGDSYFRGRYAEMWELHEGLLARSKNRDRGHPVVVVNGLGGQGKTAMCLQYARLFERDHPGGVFVIRLEGSAGPADVGDNLVRSRFEDQLRLIALRLGVPGPDDVPAALERLDEPYLWVLDDLPSGTSGDVLMDLYAPTRAGRTLVTTRGSLTRFASHGLPLGPLGPEISRVVLTAYRSAEPADRGSVAELVGLLGQHPLGLTIAAGLTTLPDFTDYRTLLADLSSSEPEQLEHAAHLEHELPAGCALPFSNALLRAYHAVTDAARDALCAASVLAPTLIPMALLSAMVGGVGGDIDKVADGLRVAANRGLVEELTPAAATVHALISRAIRVLPEASSRRARLRAAALEELAAVMETTREEYRHREVGHHLPHVRAVAGLLPGGDRWALTGDERHIMGEAGRVHAESGDTNASLRTYEALYAACAGSTAVDTYTRLCVLSGLAVAHGLEGHHTLALRMENEVAAGLTLELGPDDRDVLLTQANLGLAHLAIRDYTVASSILRDTYRRSRRVLGPTHRDTLRILNNLAIAKGHLGDAPAEQNRNRRVAHRYWLGAMAAWHRVGRPDDQYALDTRNGTALSYRALAMPSEALLLMRDLYQRRSRVLGQDHPNTLDALENLLILQEECQVELEARFESVLLGRVRGQGPGHPSTRMTLRNLVHGSLHGVTSAGGTPAALPVGVGPDGVRLDGDHVDAEIDLQGYAIDLQEARVSAFGPDDPRTMLATAYLAYALALGDHLDGQVEAAAYLAQDAYDGLADCHDDGAEHVTADDVETVRQIVEWIKEKVEYADG